MFISDKNCSRTPVITEDRTRIIVAPFFTIEGLRDYSLQLWQILSCQKENKLVISTASDYTWFDYFEFSKRYMTGMVSVSFGSLPCRDTSASLGPLKVTKDLQGVRVVTVQGQVSKQVVKNDMGVISDIVFKSERESKLVTPYSFYVFKPLHSAAILPCRT